MNNKIKKNRHAYYYLRYHLVVKTEKQYPVITGNLEKRLHEITDNIFIQKWKCTVNNIQTAPYYIHVTFESSPQIQPSVLINNFKTVSARLIRKEFIACLVTYSDRPFFWGDTYLLCTDGKHTEEIIRSYLDTQKAG